ncbi:MAG: DUF1583 domain-containing protein [Planctomycetota bacterium]
MNQLFGEEVLTENAAELCRRTRVMPAEQKYKSLCDWVLPGRGHSFRIRGAIRRSEDPIGQTEIARTILGPVSQFAESSWISSPARDLIQVADQLNQLDELADRIQAITTNDLQAQATLLTLIAVASDKTNIVAARLEEQFGWQRTAATEITVDQCWRDLLVLWAASENPRTQHLVTDDLFGAFRNLHAYHSHTEIDVLKDFLRLLKGRTFGPSNAFDVVDATNQDIKDLTSTHFEAACRLDASTHALARPLTRFATAEGMAWKISGHELDYLFYRGPIGANVDISAEVATQPGAFTEMIVHGTAAQPVGDKEVSIGRYAKGNDQIPSTHRIEPVESLTHLRARVRDGVVDHFFNGLKLHQSDATASSAPWIAFRSWRGAVSNLRNVQLVGSSDVPQSINLVANTSLGGWASYYDPDANEGLGSWNAHVGEQGDILLVSDRGNSPSNSFDEDLIRYLRPITWNARIKYEFLYRPGQTMVHPAVGRTVMVINPDNVRIHPLTDGRFESSGLRPDLAYPVGRLSNDSSNNDSSRSDPASTPTNPRLIDGWNRAAIQFTDDRLQLSINDQLVATVPIDEFNSRVFGFFHYRDQTNAVVRNVSLVGDWPRAFPPIKKQTLASSIISELNRISEQFSQTFQHDFREGIPPELFDFDGDMRFVEQMPDGVRISRNTDGGIRAMRFCAIIDGDFDIVASYRDLQISEADPTWHCGVGLALNFNNYTRDWCAIHRRRDRMQGRHYVGFGQKETNPSGKTTWVGGANVVDQSDRGRLRMVRRGNRIYGLHAVGDSDAFRLIKTTDISPGSIQIHGLRLITDIGKGMSTSATWESLEVRAASINLLQVEDSEKTLRIFDAALQNKPVSEVDLTRTTVAKAGLFPVGQGIIETSDRGVTTTSEGSRSPQRYMLIRRESLGSDFDIQVDFKVDRLDPGRENEASGEVVLQLRFEDTDVSEPESETNHVYEATMILRHRWDGSIDLRPRVVATGRGGSTLYLPIRTIPAKSPDQFRIIQHERSLYFCFSEEQSEELNVVATYPLDREVNVKAIHLYVIGSSGGGVVKTTWKRLRLGGTPPRDISFSDPIDVVGFE